MTTLAADYNQLEGDIKDLKLSSVTYLTLSNNKLTGKLSTNLLDAPNLNILDLSGNQITGCAAPCATGLPLQLAESLLAVPRAWRPAAAAEERAMRPQGHPY
jgi:hypothetical protein